jgi:CheY-like chemotaxis protein
VNLQGVGVLIVEDDVDSCQLMAFILERLCGATVWTAGSAPEALTLLNRIKPDVLLSDISMPGMDGYDLLATVRNGEPGRNQSLRAVAVTAFRHEHDRSRALRAGFQEHLTKPIDPDSLCRTLATVVGRSA